MCFDDPEWEQLVSQILAKVTEVRATVGAGLPPIFPSRVNFWGPEPRGEGLGCPAPNPETSPPSGSGVQWAVLLQSGSAGRLSP